MSTMCATITSKGQITLPATARRLLGLRAGQKVAIRGQDHSLTLEAPSDIESVRQLLRAEVERAGTWGMISAAGDGWAARAEDYRADR
ncbi:MAG: AbrB/MazE/SpoVT family DNA-binding domain-containing protein [Promicromonosporaceae bacterium]|nr:AbrB/MazE/SpoVT family DNA-binding domain-containing protein [Promicromonosporaceae bacterium]